MVLLNAFAIFEDSIWPVKSRNPKQNKPRSANIYFLHVPNPFLVESTYSMFVFTFFSWLTLLIFNGLYF